MTHTQPPKQKKRVFTWVILAINALFLIWIIVAVATNKSTSDCNGLDQQTCDNAKNAGTAIGVGLVIVFWAFVDIILGILWLVTRRRQPVIVYAQPPQGGWFQAPQDPPGTLRWWDGYRFTEHTQPQP